MISEYRKLHDDLCDLGEDISPNRAWRLARLAGIRAQIGYKKRPGSYGGSPAVVADNTLKRVQCRRPGPVAGRTIEGAIGSSPMASDITYIRTHEGFLYLAVVIDLFSRRVRPPIWRQIWAILAIRRHPRCRLPSKTVCAAFRRRAKLQAYCKMDHRLAQHYLNLGARFVAVGTDVGLLAGAASQLRQVFCVSACKIDPLGGVIGVQF